MIGELLHMSRTIDELEEKLKIATEALFKIGGMCGAPDAVEGCRNILRVSKEALAIIEADK